MILELSVIPVLPVPQLIFGGCLILTDKPETLVCPGSGNTGSTGGYGRVGAKKRGGARVFLGAPRRKKTVIMELSVIPVRPVPQLIFGGCASLIGSAASPGDDLHLHFPTGTRATRKPTLLIRYVGTKLLRIAERQSCAWLSQPPPRITRYEPVLQTGSFCSPE